MTKLKRDFYSGDDVLSIAKALLGKVLCSKVDDELTAGIITETEAYAAVNDKANHAYAGRKTERNAKMYEEGGVAYIYLCYGIHHLFNVVTNSEGVPDAVLIRAIEPYKGIEKICYRRGLTKPLHGICKGPGKLSVALGISVEDNGTDLCGDRIWIEDIGIEVSESSIITGPRVGIDYAGEDALLPYRFIFKR